MFEKPSVNPDVDDIADRAKHAYAKSTQLLAALQYRLAELAGTGQLDAEESMQLQRTLFEIWETVYAGTQCAVRDEDTDESTWDETDNTYSDGRPVMIQIRVEPEESAQFHWEHNAFLVGDGAVNEHPRETICAISPIDPSGDYITDDRQDTDFAALRRRLLEAGFGRPDEDEPPEDAGEVEAS